MTNEPARQYIGEISNEKTRRTGIEQATYCQPTSCASHYTKHVLNIKKGHLIYMNYLYYTNIVIIHIYYFMTVYFKYSYIIVKYNP